MFVMFVRIMFMFLPWHVTHDDATIMAPQQHLQTAKCKMKISRRVVSRDVISPARARSRSRAVSFSISRTLANPGNPCQP